MSNFTDQFGVSALDVKNGFQIDDSTVEGQFKLALCTHGLWPQDVDLILEIIKEQHEEMKKRWNEPADSYPLELYEALWLSVKHEAAQWLAENRPRHTFARHMLEGQSVEQALIRTFE